MTAQTHAPYAAAEYVPADAPWQDTFSYLGRIIAPQDIAKCSQADEVWQPTYDYLDQLLTQPLDQGNSEANQDSTDWFHARY